MTRTLKCDESPRQLLLSLSPRARNTLIALGYGTDQAVRDRVEEHGALSLLRSRNMYRKSYLEICEAFGFDPKGEAPAPEAIVEHGALNPDQTEYPDPGF